MLPTHQWILVTLSFLTTTTQMPAIDTTSDEDLHLKKKMYAGNNRCINKETCHPKRPAEWQIVKSTKPILVWVYPPVRHFGLIISWQYHPKCVSSSEMGLTLYLLKMLGFIWKWVNKSEDFLCVFFLSEDFFFFFFFTSRWTVSH